MNYFGHVALAAEFGGSAEFLLGSMLPDLSAIIGCPAPRCTVFDVRQGVDFHVATDLEFHETETFRTHVSRTSRELESAGMRKAPARAVSHVVFELLLDAELGKTPAHAMAFRFALGVASPHRMGAHLEWSSINAAERFESLRLRLIERSSCCDFFCKDRIVDRLVYALRSRPRLRMSAGEGDLLREWIHGNSMPSPVEFASLWLRVRERTANRWHARPPRNCPCTLASYATGTEVQ